MTQIGRISYFLKTLADAYQKTGFQVHAYCLMPNHFRLVIWKPLRRGWCLGSERFKKEVLERMATSLGEHHSGELKRECAEVKAERILSEEWQRLGWTAADLRHRRKSDPEKLQMAIRLRAETTLPVKWIAQRLNLDTWKSATTRLHGWKKRHAKPQG